MRRRRGDEEGKEEGVAMKREKDNTFIRNELASRYARHVGPSN